MSDWSSPQIARVAELVRERTGLVFPAARVRDVESVIRGAMDRRGITSVDRLARLLEEDDRAREALVAELTIGETYFQRDPAQFEVLRRRILPELLSVREDGRPIRVWSAGCASGEEPYTVAMLFEEMDAADRASIVGTDIARRRLEYAQQGMYTRWSLRSTPEETRQRYFYERGRFYELAPRIRSQVDFRYLNLAEDAFPSLSSGIWGMDVILCRNVLIYFDRETVARVARRLMATLSDDGWLLLGASDPPIADYVECDVVLTDAGLAYRPPGAAPVAERVAVPTRTVHEPEPALSGPVAGPAADTVDLPGEAEPEVGPAGSPSVQASPAIVAAYAARDFDEVRRLAEGVPEDSLTEDARLALLRALANRGCLDEAGRVIARALELHPASAEFLYMNAVLLLQAGRAADAAGVARRALYLDREMAVAHLTLAEAERRLGNRDAARRALRNAQRLLERLPADEEVPASDGESAGRLAELARVKARLLESAA